MTVTVIVVSGVPGSGKTTLARALAPELRVPLISKDVIKERLMDALGTGDPTWASELSRAAHLVMYGLVADLGRSVIVEAHFYRGTAETALLNLEQPLVQIFCRCPVELAWERYQARRDDPTRHPGHRPDHQDEDATRGWRTAPQLPLDLPAPLIEVDTSRAVDVIGLAAEVRATGLLA